MSIVSRSEVRTTAQRTNLRAFFLRRDGNEENSDNARAR